MFLITATVGMLIIFFAGWKYVVVTIFFLISTFCLPDVKIVVNIQENCHHGRLEWREKSQIQSIISSRNSAMVNFRQEKNVPSCVTYGSGSGEQMIPNATARNWERFQLLSPFLCRKSSFLQIMMMHLGRQNLSQNSH